MDEIIFMWNFLTCLWLKDKNLLKGLGLECKNDKKRISDHVNQLNHLIINICYWPSMASSAGGRSFEGGGVLRFSAGAKHQEEVFPF